VFELLAQRGVLFTEEMVECERCRNLMSANDFRQATDDEDEFECTGCGRVFPTRTKHLIVYRMTARTCRRPKVEPIRPLKSDSQFAFRLEVDVWTLTYAGKTLRLKDSLGLRCIAQLISKKGRDIHAAMLRAVASGTTAFKPLAGTEVLDEQAIHEYREQLDDLESEVQESKENNDFAKQEQIQVKIDALMQQIASATGLGGRKRKSGDDAEKARTSVTNAINRTISKIEKTHADFARHLMNSIRTGQYLCYSPETDVDWDL